MRVAVIGAGGTGGLYGGLLARAGQDVSLLARGAHLAAIQTRGLEVRSADFGTFTVHPPASSDPADLGPADLVICAVKTYDLDSATDAAAQLIAPDGVVLTLQNGLDAPDVVASRLGAEHVLIGTTALETTILEPGVIGHLTPGHQITVGAFDGPPTPAVERTVETLKSGGIKTLAVPDGRRALWDKASLLIPMATITSVCQSPIGPIRTLPPTRALLIDLVREVALVARAYGYELTDALDRALATIDRVAPTMKASMARDFERGRRTELEALTGGLLRLAEARDINVPATRTAYAILKLREQGCDQPEPVGSAPTAQ